MERPDLSEFRELNARKASWQERSAAIEKRFPSVARLDWEKAFTSDVGMLGRLLNDILKIGDVQPGKPGKRPSVFNEDATGEDRYSLKARAEVHTKVRQLVNDDYTTEDFPEAFRVLAGQRSVRHLASKTGLDRNMIYKIQQGYTPPMWAIEKIAHAFKKKPEYFSEYRSAYVLGVLHEHLDRNPETSMIFFLKIRGQKIDNA